MSLAALREHVIEMTGGSPRRAALLLAALVVLAALPLGVAALLAHLDLRSQYRDAELDAQRTALILMHDFQQTVEPIDSLLQNFARSLEPDASATRIYDALRALSLPEGIVQVAVAGRNGLLVASNLAPPSRDPVDVSDREHIQVHMGEQPVQGLFISKPVLGRVSRMWTIQFSRAWRSDRGELLGVISASYAIDDFIGFYNRLRTEPNMLISLVGMDGIVRARAAGQIGSGQVNPSRLSPGQMSAGQLSPGQLSFGENVADSPSFQEARVHAEGPYEAVSSIDGIARIGYFVRSLRYPIIVLVAYDTASVRALSDPSRAAIWLAAVGASLILVAAGGLGLGYHRLRQQAQATALKESTRQREVNFLEAMAGVPGVCVIHVTPSGSRQIGDTSGNVLPELIHQYVASPRFAAATRALTGPQVSVEYFARDGEEFEVQLMIAPLEELDPTAPPAMIGQRDLVVFAVDQTSKRIEENNLYQMSKLASLGEVATGLAHEINQPLGVIRLAATNALTGLQKGMPPEHMEAKLNRIIQQTVRMSRIIDHMRIFGRKSGMRLEPSNPMMAVDGALQVVGAQLRLENVSVAVEGNGGDVRVLCRQDQLEQVVINLLQNARDAIRERRRAVGLDYVGAIAIDMSVEDPGSRAPVVAISVKDNAGGIPEAVIEKVFQPFFTTKPPGQGTGLGLSVSFGIIRDHGGTLTVENAFDGAVFTIRLPGLHESQLASPRG